MEFRLPALGEGIDSATVVGVLVKPGDAVSAGQNVIAVETDKAAVEVPVETAGTVGEVHVKPGDKIPAGGLILTLRDGAAPQPAAAPAKPTKAGPPQPPADKPAPAGGAKIEFRLPALGEGIDTATVVGVLVKPGDTVKAGQNVIAVETDKASVEVPVDTDGTVAEVHVKPGDKIPAGAPVLALHASGGREPPGAPPSRNRPPPRKRSFRHSHRGAHAPRSPLFPHPGTVLSPGP